MKKGFSRNLSYLINCFLLKMWDLSTSICKRNISIKSLGLLLSKVFSCSNTVSSINASKSLKLFDNFLNFALNGGKNLRKGKTPKGFPRTSLAIPMTSPKIWIRGWDWAFSMQMPMKSQSQKTFDGGRKYTNRRW